MSTSRWSTCIPPHLRRPASPPPPPRSRPRRSRRWSRTRSRSPSRPWSHRHPRPRTSTSATFQASPSQRTSRPISHGRRRSPPHDSPHPRDHHDGAPIKSSRSRHRQEISLRPQLHPRTLKINHPISIKSGEHGAQPDRCHLDKVLIHHHRHLLGQVSERIPGGSTDESGNPKQLTDWAIVNCTNGLYGIGKGQLPAGSIATCRTPKNTTHLAGGNDQLQRGCRGGIAKGRDGATAINSSCATVAFVAGTHQAAARLPLIWLHSSDPPPSSLSRAIHWRHPLQTTLIFLLIYLCYIGLVWTSLRTCFGVTNASPAWWGYRFEHLPRKQWLAEFVFVASSFIQLSRPIWQGAKQRTPLCQFHSFSYSYWYSFQSMRTDGWG